MTDASLKRGAQAPDAVWWSALQAANEEFKERNFQKSEQLALKAMEHADHTTYSARNKVITLGFIGRLYDAQRRHEQAEEAFESALIWVKQVDDADDHVFALTMQDIAFHYLGGRNEFEAAVVLQRFVADVMERVLPDGELDKAFAYYRLGELLYCNDENKEADAALGRALDIVSESDDLDFVLMVCIIELMADNLMDMHDQPGAFQLYTQALELIEEFIPERIDLLQRIVDRRAEITRSLAK